MATIVLSAAAHTAAIGTLVRLPGRQAVEWTAEQATIIAYLAANRPPAEEPPPPTREPDRAAVAAPVEVPAPLPSPEPSVPLEPPSELPPIEARLAAVAEPEPPVTAMFGSGVGEGGSLTLDSIAVFEELHLPPGVALGERFRLPRLRNRELIVSILQRRYPSRLAFRGLSSAATLRLAIDARGRVDPMSVKVIAFDREEFALIVMDVARRFRFAPAHYRGENVPIIIDIPVEWKAGP